MITTIAEAENFFKKHKGKKLDIRVHKTITGAECYRVVSEDGTPLVNIQKKIMDSVNKKKERQGVEKNG